MKKLKELWAKARDKIVPVVTDMTIEHPNVAFVLILSTVLVNLVFLLGLA